MLHMQNFTEFIATFQHIDETQGYEASEQYINQNIQQIKAITDPNILAEFLNFLSEITGEGEAYERLCDLLTYFQNNHMITQQQAQQYITHSPCNRWL